MAHNKIKQLRLERAWSQEKLAQLSSLSVRTIQRVENDEEPSLETLSALASVFEVTVAELSRQPIPESAALAEHLMHAKEKINNEINLLKSMVIALVVWAVIYLINAIYTPELHYAMWIMAIWGAVLAIKALKLFLLEDWFWQWKQRRLQKLAKQGRKTVAK